MCHSKLLSPKQTSWPATLLLETGTPLPMIFREYLKKKTAERSAAVFGTPYHISCLQMLWKFQTKVFQSQVTRSREATSSQKVSMSAIPTWSNGPLWNFQQLPKLSVSIAIYRHKSFNSLFFFAQELNMRVGYHRSKNFFRFHYAMTSQLYMYSATAIVTLTYHIKYSLLI